MSKEKKFHQFIEELNQEEKALAWKKIQERDISNTVSIQPVSFFAVKRSAVAPWKKALLSCLVSIIVVGAGVFGGIKLFAKDEPPSTRYCDASMYTMQDVTITLKERSLEEENLLFLDWYEITDFYVDQIYTLKDSNQEIGYYEQIMDINTGSLVTIHIIQNQYKLLSMDIYENLTQTTYINSISTKWIYAGDFSYAQFAYSSYNYYISLEYPMEEDSILDIVEEMLLSA